MRCEPWAGCEPSKSMNIGLVELVNLLVGSAHGNYLVALQEKVHKVHKVHTARRLPHGEARRTCVEVPTGSNHHRAHHRAVHHRRGASLTSTHEVPRLIPMEASTPQTYAAYRSSWPSVGHLTAQTLKNAACSVSRCIARCTRLDIRLKHTSFSASLLGGSPNRPALHPSVGWVRHDCPLHGGGTRRPNRVGPFV